VLVMVSMPCGTWLSTAQVVDGSISGVVMDFAGAVLPETTVTATSGSAHRHVTTTGPDGQYRIVLPPDVYRIEAALAGFPIAISEGIVVESGHDVTWSPKLTLPHFDIPSVESLAEAFAGPDVRHCGEHPHDATGNALGHSLGCVRAARAARLASVTIKYAFGIDSHVATGLIGRADGTVFTFFYDSSPCGSEGHCPHQFSVEPCASPRVKKERQGASFVCGSARPDDPD
jgi:hypothetical protein